MMPTKEFDPLPLLKRLPSYALIPFFLAGIWTVLLLAGAALLEKCPDALQSLGQFGDSFGILNSLVSLFALIAAIYAAGYQYWQFLQQRHEIHADRLHAEELLRREKLEKLTLGLLDLSERFARKHAEWGGLITIRSKQPHYDLRSAMPATEFASLRMASRQIDLLAKLYFRSQYEQLTSRKIVDEWVVRVEELANETNQLKEMREGQIGEYLRWFGHVSTQLEKLANYAIADADELVKRIGPVEKD